MKKMICLLSVFLLAAVETLLPAGAGAETWPQETFVDEQGRTIKKVPAENGKTEIWELVGIFGGEDEILKSIGFEETKKVEIGGKTYDFEMKKIGKEESEEYAGKLEGKRNRGSKSRKSAKKRKEKTAYKYSMSGGKAETQIRYVYVKRGASKRIRRIKIRNLRADEKELFDYGAPVVGVKAEQAGSPNTTVDGVKMEQSGNPSTTVSGVKEEQSGNPNTTVGDVKEEQAGNPEMTVDSKTEQTGNQDTDTGSGSVVTAFNKLTDFLRRVKKMTTIAGWTDPANLIYLQDNQGSGL